MVADQPNRHNAHNNKHSTHKSQTNYDKQIQLWRIGHGPNLSHKPKITRKTNNQTKAPSRPIETHFKHHPMQPEALKDKRNSQDVSHVHKTNKHTSQTDPSAAKGITAHEKIHN